MKNSSIQQISQLDIKSICLSEHHFLRYVVEMEKTEKVFMISNLIISCFKTLPL